ncbi:hypothetical protein [Fictibacillus sp. JL2B1089]|uniref:hypothetical protein n=1 Tax=Fictibacillus sp. JL2B1089 TaxID=3399565 RepID=UPI003A8458D6
MRILRNSRLQFRNNNVHLELEQIKQRLNILENQTLGKKTAETFNAGNNSNINTNDINELFINEKKLFIESKEDLIKVEEYLFTLLENEEKVLKEYRFVLKRYNALSSSKLGKLTLFYWKIRRNLFRRK